MSHVLVRTFAGVVAAAAAVVGLTAAASPAHPRPHPQPPVGVGADYLALGDSVSFGYREPANLPTPDYHDAATFVGYPEDVAADLGLHVANAACPGETSASLIDATAPSNGCEATGSTPGYRTLYPLHVSYTGSQLDYAVHYLRTHRQTRLVSLMIGANDAFVCEKSTADKCVSEFPAVLAEISRNVTTILRAIRHEARYVGQLVIVNYYSLDYADPVQAAQSQALNQAMDSAARPFHTVVADGFGAFQRAAAQTSGNVCAAGLITVLSTGGCGIHPSVAGQMLLAGAVERVVRKR